MKYHPYRFATKILQWFCHAEFVEEVEGDLYELFRERVERVGPFRAKLYYLLDVLHSINPRRSEPRKPSRPSLPYRDRLGHFFIIAFRNMLRSKSSSILNLSGLAISLTGFLLIALYLIDEATYDSFHPDADHVYRISYSFRGFDGKEGRDARAAGLWCIKLKESMPEVKAVTRFSRFGYPGNVRTSDPDHVFVEQQFFWVDPNFTDIFSLPLITAGDAKKILSDPQHVIINETIARKYFGTDDPVGQPITYVRDGMEFQLIVGAVMKCAPSNTHFKPDFIASSVALDPLWKRNNEDRINSWMDSFSYSFVTLEPGTDPAKVTHALQEIFNQNLGEFAKVMHPILTPLQDIHFTEGFMFELDAPGDKVHLYIFGSIALLILAMACINYMNLATARSISRSKEVGLRKTLGAGRKALVVQFLGESLLMTGIALAIAITLLVVVLPYFNALTLKDFSLAHLLQTRTVYLLLTAFITVGTLAGCYPAFYLSAFRPIEALKGSFTVGRAPENFRKALVVVQISITLLIITGTYVIHHQLAFIDHTKLSEYKDQIVTVRLGESVARQKIAGFKQIAQQNPHVREISTGPHLPRRENFGFMGRAFQFRELDETQRNWDHLDVDFDFPSMFRLEFVAGRNFSVNNPSDTMAIILNETAVKELGVTAEKAIGLQAENTYFIEVHGKPEPVTMTYKVIGVAKDFNYASVRKIISPIAIGAQWRATEMMYIMLAGDKFSETLDHLQNVWKQVYPSTPFQYWFMDEEFGRLYQTERQMAKLFRYLGGMAMIIACLGIFGLASFTAEQKTKEIGIRKVMGASTLQILLMLTSRYVRLALIAFFIGIPLAAVAVHSWMESFVYKAEIGGWYMLWACLLILLVTVFTVGFESLRAARANPSVSMRHE